MRFSWRIALAALALVALACATPVGVKRVDVQTVHRTLTANVLSRGEPSPFSIQLLRRLALDDRYRDDPESALAELHASLAEPRERDRLFALAELSFHHAGEKHARAWFLASAIYAYAFLFPEQGEPPPAFDPRRRLAADLYNRALTSGFADRDRSSVALAGGRYALPFGELEVQLDAQALVWGQHRLVKFAPVAEFQVRGLRNRYRRPGIGAPLAALVEAPDAEQAQAATLRLSADHKVPVTALLRIEAPFQSIQTGKVRGVLELYAEDLTSAVRIAGQEVPLEYEPTAVLAYSLHEAAIWEFEIRGYLSGQFRNLEGGLYALHPYHPGRVPVVLVHGTASSPARWAEMLNELMSDSYLGPRCQFWLFLYNTGNPILYSAMKLRESLTRAGAELDPEKRDPALRRMVVIGHSQGGLLTRLVATESGTHFWDALFSVPPEELEISPETRDLIQRILFFEPVDAITRVVFIATPHRGSFLAGRRLGKLAAGLVTLPVNLARAGVELLGSADTRALRSVDRFPSSVEAMDPESFFVEALAKTQIAESVSVHSIIPVKGSGPPVKLDDGVVDYLSAHIANAVSELVVRSGHSTQSTPHTIEEVRRILREHLETP